MRRRSGKAALGALVVMVLVAGCTEKDDSSLGDAYRGPVNACTANADCRQGGVCDKSLSMCVRRDDLSKEKYIVRLTPRARDAETFEVSLSGKKKVFALRKEESVQIRLYTVKTTEFADGGVLEEEVPESFRGTLVVTDRVRDVLEQAPPSWSWQVFSDDTVDIHLPPGKERYAMALIPEEASADLFPPQYLDSVTIRETVWDTDSETSTESAGQSLPFQLFPATAVLEGKIKRGHQLVDGVTVEAVEPATGRTISTRAKTGCIDNSAPGAVCGEFNIGLMSGETPYALKVYRPEERGYPTSFVPAEEASSNSGSQLFSLPVLPSPVRYTARVEKPVVLANGKVIHDGITDCLVIFESADDGISGGHVVVSALTDQTGTLIRLTGGETPATAAIDLYPGTYRVTVIPKDVSPDAAEDFSILEEERDIGGSDNPIIASQAFSLSFRPRIRVKVTAGGVRIPSAVIQSAPMVSSTTHARKSHSSTGEDGVLTLWLDPGRHLLTAEVSAMSGYAFSFRTVDIPWDARMAERPVAIPMDDIEAEIPNVVEMQVLTNDPDIEVKGVDVEWYQVLEDESAAVLVARTSTGNRGTARMYLPSPSALHGK